MTYHIAQLNIARMIEDINSPRMSSFVARLKEINQLGEATRGFVWRLKDEDEANDSAVSIRPFSDPMLIVNMTVWESIEALFEYTYHSDHVEVFRKRLEWFQRMEKPMMALWWIPAGHIPTLEEAKERLDYLQQHGPSPYAFTFKQRYTADEAARTSGV